MTAAPVIDNALAGARRMAHMPQPNRATRRVFAFDRMRRLWQCRAGFFTSVATDQGVSVG
jgi:hypothetical protein